MGRMMRSSLLVSLLFIISASASPKGRLKVKYRVKPGGDKVMVKTVTEEGVAEKDNVEEVLTNEVDGDALMLEARDLLMASTPDSLGDIIFDVVKEVVAEQISGLLSRSLGISTARSSGSIMETVFRAIANVGQPKSC